MIAAKVALNRAADYLDLAITHRESAVVGRVPGRDVRRPDHDPGGEAGHHDAEHELGEGESGAQEVAVDHRRKVFARN